MRLDPTLFRFPLADIPRFRTRYIARTAGCLEIHAGPETNIDYIQLKNYAF